MPFASILWDVEDDADGNVQHCAQHGTPGEVEEVFQNATDADISRPPAGLWFSEIPAPADI